MLRPTPTILGLAAACVKGDTAGPAAQHQVDAGLYEALQDELMANASVAVALDYNYAGMRTSPNRLWYARYASGNSALDLFNLDPGTLKVVECGEIAGSETFRASDEMSAVGGGIQGDIELFDSDSCDLVTVVRLPAPEYDGSTYDVPDLWWPYAVDGDALYAVVGYPVDRPDVHRVYRWRAGTLTPLGALEEAGYDVSEFSDFSVRGDTLVYVESGRLYVLDLDTWSATWVEHEQPVEPWSRYWSWDDTHVLFVAEDGAFLWDRVAGTTRDFGAMVNALPDHSPAYADLEDYVGGDATLADGVVYYESARGLMAYDVDSGVITPLVLDELDGSLTFHAPAVAGGVVFALSYNSFEADYTDINIWRLTP